MSLERKDQAKEIKRWLEKEEEKKREIKWRKNKHKKLERWEGKGKE